MSRANRFFDGHMLDLLAAPERWALISSHAPPDVAPMKRPPRSRVQWSRRHTHSHANPEFLLVLKGRGCHGYQGALYRYAPGTAFYFDSFERHDLGYPRSAPDTDHLWISLLHEQIFAFVLSLRSGAWASARRVRCVLSPPWDGIAPTAFLRARDGADLPAEWKRARLLAALHAVVVKIVEKGFEQREDTPDAGRFQGQVVEAVQQHIRETAGRGVSLDSLARIAGYSKFHFLRLFQRHTGRTVLDYINGCRREKVREMRGRGRSHKEIGAALGFSCPAAFSRWYRGQSESGVE